MGISDEGQGVLWGAERGRNRDLSPSELSKAGHELGLAGGGWSTCLGGVGLFVLVGQLWLAPPCNSASHRPC